MITAILVLVIILIYTLRIHGFLGRYISVKRHKNEVSIYLWYRGEIIDGAYDSFKTKHEAEIFIKNQIKRLR